MSSRTVLIAVSILAAAIAYAGNQLRGETIVVSPEVAVSTSAMAQQAGDPGAGAAYAKQYCSKCHAIGDTQISPEPKAPRFKDIANTPGMIPAVLDVWLRRPHLYMPNIVVEADQIDNVIAYIMSLKKSQ
jgi:mono/diheme cytochrome c family protein